MANFIRKHVNPFGTYYAAYKTGEDENGNPTIIQEIKIEGRNIFATDDRTVSYTHLTLPTSDLV